jgi:actin-related protein
MRRMCVSTTAPLDLANQAQEAMTEEQRMEEGRRMFQIFAARMFEQRVLQAYREKVAAERQRQLLEELAEEDEQKDLKEAKKAKEAQKRKEKKDKLRQAKAEEKAKKDAEIAAKEAEIKAAEEKRLEEQRKKREEQRKKKEAERKAQEEEKQRKEAERQKRQQEERDRQQESERKAREQKALEKKAKDDAKRKEREEREAKEKEAREKKAHDDSQRKERETRSKADKDRLRKDELAAIPIAVPGGRKVSQPVAPALPPQLLKQTSSTGMPSPLVTPAVPKAPTPSRPRQTSQQGSHGSSPKTPHVAPGTSKSMSPTSQMQGSMMPKSILTKPPASQQSIFSQHNLHTPQMPPIGPPPGLQGPPGLGMGGMPPGLNGFPGPGPGSMMPNLMGSRSGLPFYPQPGSQNFRGFPPPGMPPTRGFPLDGPPGLGSLPPFPGSDRGPPFGLGLPTHSRQGSGSFERLSGLDSPIAAPSAQPIQRPAPIQRPSSVKPHELNHRHQGSDVEELADHLGSKALLDDGDDIPEIPDRRLSLQQHGSMRSAPIGFGFPDAPPSLQSTSYTQFGGPKTASIWGTPPPQQYSNAGAAWGNSPTAGFFTNPIPSTAQTHERRPNEARLIWLRRIVCSACKMVAARVPTPDGYIDAMEVHRQIDTLRNPLEPPVLPEEIKEACDIIDGTPTNGGGSLEYKQLGDGRLSQIKFIDVPGPPSALGEIGSPIVGHSHPVAGFGRFPGLGPQGF